MPEPRKSGYAARLAAYVEAPPNSGCAPPPTATAAPTAAPAARQAPSPWDDLKFDVKPRLMRLEPERAQRWPWIVLVVLATLAFGVFFWLPRYAPPEWIAAFSAAVDPVAQSAADAVDSATAAVGEAKSALTSTHCGRSRRCRVRHSPREFQ